MEIDGRELQFGDFLIIASANALDFGWYAGTGKTGTLQYYSVWNPRHIYEQWLEYKRTEALGNPKYKFLFEKSKGQLLVKHFYKSYINTPDEYRVLYVKNPDELFNNDSERKQKYEESKQALIEAKFLQP